MPQVKATSLKFLGENFDGLMGPTLGLPVPEDSRAPPPPVSNTDMRKLFFGDYMDTNMEPEDRRWAF